MSEPLTNADVWERRRIQASLRIERAGLQLLSERGLDGVTVDQIATAAGISARTFFRYFRNVRDVLAAVPVREVRRMCRGLSDRPAEESLLEAFHGWFGQIADRTSRPSETDEIELELVALWSQIVRAAPEVVQSESNAINVLAAGLDDVVRMRLGPALDDEDAGALSAAFAAVIWYTYTRSVQDEAAADLATRLNRAFDALGRLPFGVRAETSA